MKYREMKAMKTVESYSWKWNGERNESWPL
jgi:hypothetical protein